MRYVDVPDPMPGPGEVRVVVDACGVCRTDLHVVEGDLPLHRRPITPGHEVVGRVEAVGTGATRFALGDRIGVPWLRSTCGTCRYCARRRENLCPASRYTGWDADGGYARFAVIGEAFAYRLPDAFSDVEAAPLLCAGIIGFRALRRADVPEGGRLGIYGFGGSAHLAAQVARAEGASVYVFTRSADARALALDLGATWVGDTFDTAPEPLDSAVVFAPAGEIVPAALRAVDRGGTVAVAGIHLSDIPVLRYQDHLFQERQLRSVTANTREDGEQFLAIAARIGIRVHAVPYPMDEADRALRDLAHDRLNGAAVLVP
jgi:propanol-preferring alcohol dehydrogenase